MGKIFRWGLVGPGRIAHKFAAALDSEKTGTLTAIASRNKERAEVFAKAYKAEAIFNNYNDLANRSDIDGVYIATPHAFHYEQAKLFLTAGKPVLCEKPLTVNAQQTADLIALSQQHNVFLMEAMWSRFLPLYQHIKTLVTEGVIGDILQLQACMGFPFPRSPSGRLLSRDLAGGVLLDLGVYSLNITQYLLCENPTHISATAFIGETGVDETLQINLQYPGNRFLQCAITMRSMMRNTLFISGTKGEILIDLPFWGTTTAKVSHSGKEEMLSFPFRQNGFEYQIEGAVRSISEGVIDSRIIPHADTLSIMQQMDEIRSIIGLQYPFE